MWISGDEHSISFLGPVGPQNQDLAHVAPGARESLSSLPCLMICFGAEFKDGLMGQVPHFSQASLTPFWKQVDVKGL